MPRLALFSIPAPVYLDVDIYGNWVGMVGVQAGVYHPHPSSDSTISAAAGLILRCARATVRPAIHFYSLDEEVVVFEAEQMGVDAVVGVDVAYEPIQIRMGGSMLMVSASGTAERL